MKVRDVIKLIESAGWYLVTTTGRTRDQVARDMHEAIEMHVRGLLEDKQPVPRSRSFAEHVVSLA